MPAMKIAQGPSRKTIGFLLFYACHGRPSSDLVRDLARSPSRAGRRMAMQALHAEAANNSFEL